MSNNLLDKLFLNNDIHHGTINFWMFAGAAKWCWGWGASCWVSGSWK